MATEKMFSMKSFSKSTLVGLLFGLFLIGYAVFAFQSPTQAPPAGNTPTPVNVGAGDQVKSGGFWVGSLGVSGGATFGEGVKVGEFSTAARPLCTNDKKGTFIFDTNLNQPFVCAGAAGWQTSVTKQFLDAQFAAVGLVDTDGDKVVDNLDCAPNDATRWQNKTVYPDSDGDGYGNAALSELKCVGTSPPLGFKETGTDCYDVNSNARPGQTSYFSSHRGDGSFDYNCSGSIEYYDGATAVAYLYNSFVSTANYYLNSNCSGNTYNPQSSCPCTSLSQSHCGTSGRWAAGQGNFTFYAWAPQEPVDVCQGFNWGPGYAVIDKQPFPVLQCR